MISTFFDLDFRVRGEYRPGQSLAFESSVSGQIQMDVK